MPTDAETLKNIEFDIKSMYIYSEESELAFLKRFWNDLTNDQRSNVIEKFYQNDSIDTETLEELLMRHEEPHVEEFPIPDITLCMNVLDQMTPEETQKLVTYTSFSIPDLKDAIQDSDVLFYVLQNHLARNFTLHLPPVEVFVIPDKFEIPMKLRRKSRAHRRKLNPTHSV